MLIFFKRQDLKITHTLHSFSTFRNIYCEILHKDRETPLVCPADWHSRDMWSQLLTKDSVSPDDLEELMVCRADQYIFLKWNEAWKKQISWSLEATMFETDTLSNSFSHPHHEWKVALLRFESDCEMWDSPGSSIGQVVQADVNLCCVYNQLEKQKGFSFFSFFNWKKVVIEQCKHFIV